VADDERDVDANAAVGLDFDALPREIRRPATIRIPDDQRDSLSNESARVAELGSA
jgi:hypothetical protein